MLGSDEKEIITGRTEKLNYVGTGIVDGYYIYIKAIKYRFPEHCLM